MTQFTDPRTLSKADLESGSIFAPKFDANGLVTALTVEAGSNEVLMVAHMNAEAIAETLRSGHATYWSRSRGKLWKKGETSGELQELVELRTDCDQDALVVVVRQTGHGAACHTGRKSCFYRRVEMIDGDIRLSDTGDAPLFDPEEVYGR
ncbi:phosphoribosyl-AMP cyclohydrolase [Pelagibacterium halotolerans]|uniref:Phosphoribosyl-AMP cyclohydrolase n=1 Tax=Pelagibacterium halotolerans (strain DSM 22347 / JCM 15775 / CGMCC 1.7692 / B2) TaxID=1082931 RepID=G4RDH2_PELHB|nr:phosphoribosyl-AMP cyclohydrolase [Pelagibacterium halotolerans]AEQ51773.1 phosphoribosyl-AMP cyclohydrolase [Pelagibacterium halotolerans B2]QJR18414.1 phosphoribosyl-AMP cyclohydrolase [Pelagibacterium halotolerans]SEA22988.1 phosphoribosyl-AMP cyclohydrolase [Pelagibacterium halotolerans]